MKPFTPPALEEIIREELEELENRPNDPRTLQELRESFRHYRRAMAEKSDWSAAA